MQQLLLLHHQHVLNGEKTKKKQKNKNKIRTTTKEAGNYAEISFFCERMTGNVMPPEREDAWQHCGHLRPVAIVGEYTPAYKSIKKNEGTLHDRGGQHGGTRDSTSGEEGSGFDSSSWSFHLVVASTDFFPQSKETRFTLDS